MTFAEIAAALKALADMGKIGADEIAHLRGVAADAEAKLQAHDQILPHATLKPEGAHNGS